MQRIKTKEKLINLLFKKLYSLQIVCLIFLFFDISFWFDSNSNLFFFLSKNETKIADYDNQVDIHLKLGVN